MYALKLMFAIIPITYAENKLKINLIIWWGQMFVFQISFLNEIIYKTDLVRLILFTKDRHVGGVSA